MRDAIFTLVAGVAGFRASGLVCKAAIGQLPKGTTPKIKRDAVGVNGKGPVAALTAMGFEGRAGFQYNYALCLMAEYGPRANDALN
jgi:hypothetical protein